MGANSFLNEMTQTYIGGNNQNDKIVSLESVPIFLMRLPLFIREATMKMTELLPLRVYLFS